MPKLSACRPQRHALRQACSGGNALGQLSRAQGAGAALDVTARQDAAPEFRAAPSCLARCSYSRVCACLCCAGDGTGGRLPQLKVKGLATLTARLRFICCCVSKPSYRACGIVRRALRADLAASAPQPSAMVSGPLRHRTSRAERSYTHSVA